MKTDNLKVLLIEDNPGDAFLVKFYLEEFKAIQYELTHAQELSEAFKFLNESEFDIILIFEQYAQTIIDHLVT